MRLAASWFPLEDEGPALRDEVRREGGPKHLQADCRLIREIEIVDRFEKRKVGPPREAGQPCLLAVGGFFGRHDGEKSRYAQVSRSARSTRSRHTRRALARWKRLKSASRSWSAAIMTGLRRAERIPPCSAASRGSAALRPCSGASGALDPASARQPVGGYRRWPVPVVKRQRGDRGPEIVRDVFGPDCLLREAAIKRDPQGRLAYVWRAHATAPHRESTAGGAGA